VSSASLLTTLGWNSVGAGGDPKDLVHAYMWFLIAGEQITQAKNHLNQSMTMEQLLEAEQRAAEWMRKSKKIPPSLIEIPPNASTA
jgi:hypothetical protein